MNDVKLDYEELHSPYKGVYSPGPYAQLIWLRGKGFSDKNIHEAMKHVYHELHTKSKSFVDTEITDNEGNKRPYAAGAQLDHYLLSVAHQKREEDARQEVSYIADAHNTLLGRYTLWQRIKAVFKPEILYL